MKDDTKEGIIEEGSLAILALVTEDGASDHGICMSPINGRGENEKSREEEVERQTHESLGKQSWKAKQESRKPECECGSKQDSNEVNKE